MKSKSKFHVCCKSNSPLELYSKFILRHQFKFHKIITLVAFIFFSIALSSRLFAQEQVNPSDYRPLTENELALEHYNACDFESKYTAPGNPKKDEELKAFYKAKKKDYSGCVAYGEYKEKAKQKDKAKLAYALACKEKIALGCVRLGNSYLLETNETKALEAYKMACDMGFEEGCKRLNYRHEESNLLFYTSLLLIGLAVFIVARTIFLDEGQFKAAEQLETTNTEKKNLAQYGVVLKYSRPFFKRYVSPIVESMKGKKKIKEKYKRTLSSAGLNEVLTPEDFYAFKIFLILGFPIVFMVVRFIMEESWSLTFVPLMAVFGYVYPDIWAKGVIQRRQRDLIKAMPFAVDMLALSVEAGLDFIAAMSKVMDKAKKSALTEEFSTVIKEIKIGASRAEALRNLAWRCDLIQMSSFCATLIAADSVGASIGPILKNLSKEIRQKKSSDAEKAGATAATKILFPMLMFITPAVFIVIAAPMILDAMGLK